MGGQVRDLARQGARPAVVHIPRRQPEAGPDSGSPVAQRILELQRAAGNAAVVQLIGEDQDANGTTPDVAEARAAFDAGAAAYDRGDYAHAYDSFVRAYELAPRPGLLFSQGQALRKLGGRREEAIECYERYLASDHESRRAEAEQHLVELRGPAPTGEEAIDNAAGREIFDRGAAAYDRGDFAHAYDEFTKAYELTGRPGLVFSRAQALRRLGGRREEAIALYEAYLDSGHGARDAEARQYLGELRGPTPTGDEEIDSAAAKAIFDRGAAAYDRGEFGSAYDEFTKAYEILQRPGLLFSRAQALRRLGGRRDEAIELYGAYLASGHGKRDTEAKFHVDELRRRGTSPR